MKWSSSFQLGRLPLDSIKISWESLLLGTLQSKFKSCGAGGTWTLKALRPVDFKSTASADSATAPESYDRASILIHSPEVTRAILLRQLWRFYQFLFPEVSGNARSIWELMLNNYSWRSGNCRWYTKMVGEKPIMLTETIQRRVNFLHLNLHQAIKRRTMNIAPSLNWVSPVYSHGWRMARGTSEMWGG